MINTQFLRIKDVVSLTTLSTSNIWDKVAKGNFPMPTKLSTRVSVWTLEQVEMWMKDQIEQHQIKVTHV